MKVQVSNIEHKIIKAIMKERKSGVKRSVMQTGLAQDVFELGKDNYVILNGKKILEKDLPNSVSGPSDYVGIISHGQVEFYPEDIEKMKHMKVNERIKFKSKLIEQNRFVGGEKYIK